jgi:hypothetical protein
MHVTNNTSPVDRGLKNNMLIACQIGKRIISCVGSGYEVFVCSGAAWSARDKRAFLGWVRFGPSRDMASSFMRFLDHTQRRTTVRRPPPDEWSARRRDLYLKTRQSQQQTSMSPAGFEPTMSAGERSQTSALDRAATDNSAIEALHLPLYCSAAILSTPNNGLIRSAITSSTLLEMNRPRLQPHQWGMLRASIMSL